MVKSCSALVQTIMYLTLDDTGNTEHTCINLMPRVSTWVFEIRTLSIYMYITVKYFNTVYKCVPHALRNLVSYRDLPHKFTKLSETL